MYIVYDHWKANALDLKWSRSTTLDIKHYTEGRAQLLTYKYAAKLLRNSRGALIHGNSLCTAILRFEIPNVQEDIDFLCDPSLKKRITSTPRPPLLFFTTLSIWVRLILSCEWNKRLDEDNFPLLHVIILVWIFLRFQSMHLSSHARIRRNLSGCHSPMLILASAMDSVVLLPDAMEPRMFWGFFLFYPKLICFHIRLDHR